MSTSPNVQPWIPSEGKYFKDSPQMEAIYNYLKQFQIRRNVDKQQVLSTLEGMIQQLDHPVSAIRTFSFEWPSLFFNALWLLRYFIKSGLNPHVQIESDSLLGQAAGTNTEALELLLRAGGCSTIHPGDDIPLLHRAVSSTYIRRIQLLMQYGANINAQDSHGDTPLHLISRELSSKGHMCMLHHLLTYGPDIHIRNTAGCTVLHTVHSPQMAQVFIENGADIHAQDCEGRTPLHYVVLRVVKRRCFNPNEPLTEKVDTGLLKLFLAHGAKVTVPDRSGKTVFDYAQQYSERWVSIVHAKMEEETKQTKHDQH